MENVSASGCYFPSERDVLIFLTGEFCLEPIRSAGLCSKRLRSWSNGRNFVRSTYSTTTAKVHRYHLPNYCFISRHTQLVCRSCFYILPGLYIAICIQTKMCERFCHLFRPLAGWHLSSTPLAMAKSCMHASITSSAVPPSAWQQLWWVQKLQKPGWVIQINTWCAWIQNHQFRSFCFKKVLIIPGRKKHIMELGPRSNTFRGSFICHPCSYFPGTKY